MILKITHELAISSKRLQSLVRTCKIRIFFYCKCRQIESLDKELQTMKETQETLATKVCVLFEKRTVKHISYLYVFLDIALLILSFNSAYFCSYLIGI